MTTKLKSIRNNIFSVSIAQIISLLLNIVTFGIIARVLSINDFGTFNYLLAIIGFVAKFIDLGINPIVLRETTKNGNFSEYLSSTLLVKSILIILVLIIINLYSLIFTNSFTENLLLNLFTINVFFSNKYTNIRELLITPYKVSLKMGYPMLLVLLDGVLLLVFSLFINPNQNALILFGLAYVISNIPSTIVLIIMLRKQENLKFSFNSGIFKSLLKMSLPIYGYVVLMVIYSQIDTVLIGIFNDEKSVALYSSAIRLSTPFMIFASAITLTFFPLIVNKIKNNENISKLVSSVFTIIFLFSTIISIFVFFHSKDIIGLVFGQKYILAVAPLKYLGISIVFLFINFFMVDLLTALNKQKMSFIYGVLINIFSIPLYFIFLTDYSYIGASIIKLVAIFVGSLYLFYMLQKTIKLRINYFKIAIWLAINILFFYFLSNLSFHIVVIPELIFVTISLLGLNILNYDELYTILSTVNLEKYLAKIKFLVNR